MTGLADTRQLAVLGYHKVGEPPPGSWETWYLIPEETFRDHLRYLAGSDWRVIGLDELLDGLDDPARLPERAVLLTFDDGHKSLCGTGLSRLREFGYPAVFFVPSDYVGGTTAFESDTGGPVEAACDVHDLRLLEQAGVSVQSHGASHRAFSLLDEAEREHELRSSKLALESALGKRVVAFSFPYGDAGTEPDATAAALARTGYRAAFLYGGGVVASPPANRYAVPRIAMGPQTDLAEVLAAA